MGTIIRLADHARASAGSRAARAVRTSAVRPASVANVVPSTEAHHSAGILSRCHHFDTAAALPPMSAAIASRDGQSSMIDLNDASGMLPLIRQSVLKSKDILSGDPAAVLRQNVLMGQQDQSASDFKRMFIARTAYARERCGKSQEEMATELGIAQTTYTKYETRTLMPHRFVMAFCALCDVTPAWLWTAAVEVKIRKPRKRRRKSKREAA